MNKKRKELDLNDQCIPFAYDLKSTYKYVNDEKSLNEFESMLKYAKLIGMDTERKPDFGPKKLKTNPTSLIQLCIRSLPALVASDSNIDFPSSSTSNKTNNINITNSNSLIEECVMIDLLVLTKSKKLRKSLNSILKMMFMDRNILIVGQGIENDMKEMIYSYPHMDCFEVLNSALDTNKMYRLLYPQTKQDVSLKNLVKQYLHCNLIKSQQLSNWAKRPLTENQLHYAACDAVVLIRIYDMMCVEYRNKLNRSEMNSNSPKPDNTNIMESYLNEDNNQDTENSIKGDGDLAHHGGMSDTEEYDYVYGDAFREIKRSRHSNSFDIMINGSNSDCEDDDESKSVSIVAKEMNQLVEKQHKSLSNQVQMQVPVQVQVTVQPLSLEHYQIFADACDNIDHSCLILNEKNRTNKTNYVDENNGHTASNGVGKTKTEISILIHEMINRPRNKDTNSKHVFF